MKERTVKLRIGPILALLCAGSFMGLHAASAKNYLDKVFHHKGGVEQSGADALEFGEVVFYFTDDPIVNSLPSTLRSSDKEELVFFFPLAEVKSAEGKKMIKELNSSKMSAYQVRLEEVDKPIKGLKFLISFDANRVGMTYELFESIGLQKGVVFKFFNKELLKKIAAKNRPVLKTVAAKRPYGVVLDFGHGGKDDGAVGYNKIKEKDVALHVGLEVAQLLQDHGVAVFLTRDGDREVPLDKRTLLANCCKNADIFISIHANASVDENASGIEAYSLSPALFKECFSTIDDAALRYIKKQVYERYAKGTTLAQTVHRTLLAYAQKKKDDVVDRQTKCAVGQVLLGTQLPAALLEIGFVSNKYEALLLKNKKYQQLLAQGICKGILAYLATELFA